MMGFTVGSWLGAVLIVRSSGPEFFVIMGLISFAAAFAFQAIKEIDIPVDSEQEESVLEDIKSVMRLLITKKMILANF